MKRLLLLCALAAPTLAIAATGTGTWPRSFNCPTVKQASKIFNNCSIGVGQQSCGAKFRRVPIVLNATMEGRYGGNHHFTGFKQFKGIQILDGYFTCKYTPTTGGSEKMGWVIGSRWKLPKNCRLTRSKLVMGIPTCTNRRNDPRRCKIICR